MAAPALARVPASFRCPIGGEVMVDPVTLLADGESYSRAAIESWMSLQGTSPTSGAELEDSTVVPNHNLRNAIEDWIEQRDTARGGAAGSGAAAAAAEEGESGSVEEANRRWAADAALASLPPGSPPPLPQRELGEAEAEEDDDEWSSGSEEGADDAATDPQRVASASEPGASASRAPPAVAAKKVLVKNPHSKAAQANKARRAK